MVIRFVCPGKVSVSVFEDTTTNVAVVAAVMVTVAVGVPLVSTDQTDGRPGELTVIVGAPGAPDDVTWCNGEFGSV